MLMCLNGAVNDSKEEIEYVFIDSEMVPEVPYDLSYCFLNRSYLPPTQVKLVEKIEKTIGKSDIDTILSLDSERLAEDEEFGEEYSKDYSSLRIRIIEELLVIASGLIMLDGMHKSLLVNSSYFAISLDEIGQDLLDDVEQYLSSLNERDYLLAISRWGFHEKKRTQNELGALLGAASVRIRHLESRINRNIGYHIRVHPKVLSQNIKNNMATALPELLPELRDCFEKDYLFYNFLEVLCQEKIEIPGIDLFRG